MCIGRSRFILYLIVLTQLDQKCKLSVKLRDMPREGKVILLMFVSLFLLIGLIRSLPAVLTLVIHPVRFLLFMSLIGILVYFVKKWLDDNHHDPNDDLV